ncbi:MAG: hypothetical protein ACYCYR_07010 [Desulfobulbaceae bacterium]
MSSYRDMLKRWLIPPGILDFYCKLTKKNSPGELSREERNLLLATKTLLGRHAGQRCFIVGCGSSIKHQDLTKLAGEVVITVSNAFVHPAMPFIKPKYHILSPVFAYHGNINEHEKLIEWLRVMEEKTFDAEMIFHIGDKNKIIENGLYKNRKIHWVAYEKWDEMSTPEIDLAKIPDIWSVSETAITAAIYMGFEKIYIVGFDHDWFNGLYVYFFDKDKDHKLQPDESKIDFVDSEFQMRRHAYIFKKYKYLYSFKKNIFNANANPNHYLDVFPKVDFNSLFS